VVLLVLAAAVWREILLRSRSAQDSTKNAIGIWGTSGVTIVNNEITTNQRSPSASTISLTACTNKDVSGNVCKSSDGVFPCVM
jgi:hypothetical protein